MLIRWPAAVLILVGSLAATWAPPPSQAANGLLMGQVVDGTTGRGVSGAVVTIGTAGPAPAPTAELLDMAPVARLPVGARTVMAASDGRFLFRDLSKGRYALTASVAGYVNGSVGQLRPNGPGQAIDLDDAQKLGGVTVPVWPCGSISGLVTDERSEPAVGVQVRILRRVIAGGQPRFTTSTSDATTDDRGMFRAGNVPPGDYAVGVLTNPDTAPLASVSKYYELTALGDANTSEFSRSISDSGGIMSNGTGTRVGEWLLRSSGSPLTRPAPADDGRMMTYATQFYPNATAPSLSSIVTLKPGEDRAGVDLQLKLVPALRVTGTISGPNGPGANLGLTLVAPTGVDYQSEGISESASSVSDVNGAFTFLSVPPGQYFVKVRMYPRPAPGTAGRGIAAPPVPAGPALFAVVPITVRDADVTNLDVKLQVGATVTGRLEFTGTKPAPPADQIQRVSVRLQNAEGRTSSPIPVDTRANADGTFQTAGIQAGRYILVVLASVIPAGWSVKSIMLGGKDVSVEPFDLATTDLTGAVVTFSDQSTELSGQVTGANGPDTAAEVIAFPADSDAWKQIGVPSRRGRDERTSKTGTFTCSGLPPGAYFIVAVPTAAVVEWRDPKFLESLVRSATRVTLGDGEKKSLALKTVVVR